MKHEELVKMSMKDLKARLKALNEQAKTAEGEALDAIMEEAKDISGIMADAQNRAALAGLAASADDPDPAAGEGEGEKDEQQRKGEGVRQSREGLKRRESRFFQRPDRRSGKKCFIGRADRARNAYCKRH